MSSKVDKGFTVIELIVGIALVAVLASIAAPSFLTMTQNSQISSATNEMVGHFNRARSEAIARSVPVILCRSSNVNTATPTSSTCGGGTIDNWTDGWLIYTKPGYTGSGGAGGDYSNATDELLAFHQGFDRLSVMSDGDGNPSLALNSDGSLNEDDAVRYGICDNRSTAAGRLIEISRTGRVSVSETTAADTADCDP